MPARFLEGIEYDRLPHLLRYLKALLIRSERAALNPVKDQERLRQIAPYQEALKQLQAKPSPSVGAKRQIETFRWMIEEFKVSLFAQELGTAMPISPKRLDQQLEIIRQTPYNFESEHCAISPRKSILTSPENAGSIRAVAMKSCTWCLPSR